MLVCFTLDFKQNGTFEIALNERVNYFCFKECLS